MYAPYSAEVRDGGTCFKYNMTGTCVLFAFAAIFWRFCVLIYISQPARDLRLYTC